MPVGHALFLRYGAAHHADAASALRDKVLGRAFPGQAWEVTVVDNALPPGRHGRTPEGWELFGGDNAFQEFSGWTRGLELTRARDWDASAPVILVNDTFHRNYDVAYLERFGLEPVRRWVEEGALVGHVDLYPREITLFGLAMRHWLRSSFVLAAWGVLKRLLPLLPPAPPEALFAAGPEDFIRPEAPLCATYRGYLESFLLGSAGEYQCRWHTSIAPDPAGLARLRAKAYCILCEHWLSARARDLGIPLRDVSGLLARREADMDRMAAGAAGTQTTKDACP